MSQIPEKHHWSAPQVVDHDEAEISNMAGAAMDGGGLELSS